MQLILPSRHLFRVRAPIETCCHQVDCWWAHLKASPGFPSEYPANDACTIAISSNWTGSINVIAFDVESGFDFLYVNEMAYSGSLQVAQLAGLQELVPAGNITWTTDTYVEEEGWKLCWQPAKNASLPFGADHWTCTVKGEPCKDDGTSAPCTQQFSDMQDLDSDYSVHNGHPLCHTEADVMELCGPCMCDVGEEQDYFVHTLVKNAEPQTYISCSSCAHGKFKSATGLGAGDACELCVYGHFNAFLGQTACEACGVGTVALTLGVTACAPCNSGTWGCRWCHLRHVRLWVHFFRRCLCVRRLRGWAL